MLETTILEITISETTILEITILLETPKPLAAFHGSSSIFLQMTL